MMSCCHVSELSWLFIVVIVTLCYCKQWKLCLCYLFYQPTNFIWSFLTKQNYQSFYCFVCLHNLQERFLVSQPWSISEIETESQDNSAALSHLMERKWNALNSKSHLLLFLSSTTTMLDISSSCIFVNSENINDID